MADALTYVTVLHSLVVAFKEHDGYNQYLTDIVASVAERIAAEYAANVQSVIISVLGNTFVAR